jgi:hypothetical protein
MPRPSSLRDEFTARVEEFLRHSSSPAEKNRITPTKLGLYITGNPNMVQRLRQGKDVHLTTYEKTLDFMERWYVRNGFEIQDD